MRDGRFTALLTVGPSGQMFEALDLGDDVPGALEAARTLLRERGRDRAVWFVTPSSSPAGLLEQLLSHGLEVAEEPPWEPTFASMALMEPPEPGPGDVVARPVRSFEEYVEALRLDEGVFGMPEEDRACVGGAQARYLGPPGVGSFADTRLRRVPRRRAGRRRASMRAAQRSI